MNIETFARDDHQVRVTAEFEAGAMEKYKRQAARSISMETKLPGFRPGKAPYDMVRRLVGDERIFERALELMIDELYPEIVKQSGIHPGGAGNLEEVLALDPPKFAFIIPLAPVVDLGSYLELRDDYAIPTVGEEKVDEIVTSLRKRSALAEPVDRAAEKGDLVTFKMSAKLQDAAEGSDPDLIHESTYSLEAGVPSDNIDDSGREWPFPGFNDALVGVSAGERKEIDYTFPAEAENDDLTGKTAHFVLDIENVKSLTLPEVNDEFAQQMGPGFQTVEDMRKDILSQLGEQEQRTYDEKFFDGLIARMVDGATVKYPPALLDEEIEHMLGHFTERLGRDNLDLETYLKTRDLTREAFIDQEVKPAAIRTIRRQLVLEEFAIREKIQVRKEEIEIVYDMARSQVKYDDRLKSMARNMSQKELTERVAKNTLNEIFNQRLMNRLREIAEGKIEPEPEPTESPVEAPQPVVDEIPASGEAPAATE